MWQEQQCTNIHINLCTTQSFVHRTIYHLLSVFCVCKVIFLFFPLVLCRSCSRALPVSFSFSQYSSQQLELVLFTSLHTNRNTRFFFSFQFYNNLILYSVVYQPFQHSDGIFYQIKGEQRKSKRIQIQEICVKYFRLMPHELVHFHTMYF